MFKATKWIGVGAGLGILALSGCPKEETKSTAESAAATTATSKGDGDGDKGGPTETTGTESGADGTTEGTTSAGFVPDMKDEHIKCDPWVQDCPEGEKCAAFQEGGNTWNENTCVMVKGTGKTGDPCHYDGAEMGTDDCDVGYMCWYTDKEGAGTCIPLCTGTPDHPMCEEMLSCTIANDGSLILCVYSCDPLLQDCQPKGAGCFWEGSQFTCVPAGDIPTGEPCGYINDCQPGNVCQDAVNLPNCKGSACCAAWCDLSNPACLTMGTECVAFFDKDTAPPGLENTGVCQLPGS